MNSNHQEESGCKQNDTTKATWEPRLSYWGRAWADE